MSLDIVLSKNGEVPTYNKETSISFDASADYWYLWPTMIQEIKNETGELLDLYDDASFSANDLPKLETIITKHIALLKIKKEKTWAVSVGNEYGPFEVLIKSDLENKLKKFLRIVQLAKEKSERIICLAIDDSHLFTSRGSAVRSRQLPHLGSKGFQAIETLFLPSSHYKRTGWVLVGTYSTCINKIFNRFSLTLLSSNELGYLMFLSKALLTLLYKTQTHEKD